jgi:hypothetical protein
VYVNRSTAADIFPYIHFLFQRHTDPALRVPTDTHKYLVGDVVTFKWDKWTMKGTILERQGAGHYIINGYGHSRWVKESDIVA